jgi:hypothetical protein
LNKTVWQSRKTMSKPNMLGPVSILATLPRSIDAAHGRILASTVTSLTPAKKRKRSEIAVSIDGEGVNIYSVSHIQPVDHDLSEPEKVENPRTLSSYAVPPQTYFVAPPCSVYQKTGKQGSGRRFTYAAVKNSRKDVKTQLLCLEEKIQQADPKNPKRTHGTLSSTSPVVSVHTVPSYNVTEEEPETHDVVVLHEDGTANCSSSALGRPVWTSQLNAVTQSADGPIAAKNYHVRYADFTDVGTARKGLLKGREDVLSILESGDSVIESVDSIQLLFVISGVDTTESEGYSTHFRDVHLYALQPRTSSGGPSLRSMPQHLLTWQLPIAKIGTIPHKSTYSLHASSGILEELCNGSITTYDFSGISPRIASTLKCPDGSFETFVRLSSSLLLTASSHQYAVFDIEYKSIQASLPIASGVASTTKSKKRKASSVDAPSGTPELIGYFAKAGVSVALSGLNLITIQITRDNTTSKRRKIGDTLLIDSIGRGIDLASAHQTQSQHGTKKPSCLKKNIPGSVWSLKDENWPVKVEELDDFLVHDNIPEFEASFAHALGLKTNLKQFRKGENSRTRGHGSVPLEWQYPESGANTPLPVHREKALYALSRIFAVNQPLDDASTSNDFTRHQSPIALKFDAPNIFYWLAITGQLTAPLVRQALQQYTKTDYDVSHGDVIAAIAEFDPSLSRLHMIMDSPARLDIEEITQAIKAIVQSLDDSTLPKPDPRLVANLGDDDGLTVPEKLMNGNLPLTNGDSGLTNGHIEENYNDAATDAAMEDLDNEIDYAIETLESGLPIRGESLRHALSKLNSFTSKDIVQSLRRNLSQHELVFLIHILRIELADGGWTSRYIDVGPNASPYDSGEPSDRAIGVIASILGSAVDAMGMSGWLSASASDPIDSVDELLLSLRAEISATLEGVHEATFLTGVLSEFLRYPYKRAKAGWVATRKPNQGAEKALSQGKVWRVEKAEEPNLPMGLKVEAKIDDTYVRGGGAVVKLSRKEKGQAAHRAVGKYSFEKIRI